MFVCHEEMSILHLFDSLMILTWVTMVAVHEVERKAHHQMLLSVIELKTLLKVLLRIQVNLGQ